MATSVDDAMRDAEDQAYAYDVDVSCVGCRKPAVVRFLDGEPVEADAMGCECGDLWEIV
jgi:hypothetical protein